MRARRALSCLALIALPFAVAEACGEVAGSPCDVRSACCCDGDVISPPTCGPDGTLTCPTAAVLRVASQCGTGCAGGADAPPHDAGSD